jgi:hypothetical protein
MNRIVRATVGLDRRPAMITGLDGDLHARLWAGTPGAPSVALQGEFRMNTSSDSPATSAERPSDEIEPPAPTSPTAALRRSTAVLTAAVRRVIEWH